MSLNGLLFKGASLSAFLLFSRIAVSFLLMPFIIHVLGDHDYGLWILVSAFAGYYGMLDFGISGAILRFVSREIGAGRQENTKYYINSALFVLCGLGLLIIIISFVVSWCVSFFMGDTQSLAFFKFALIVLGLTIGLSFPLRVFDGVLSAHLRFDLKRYVEFMEVVFRSAFIVVLLKTGFGLYGLVFVVALAGVAELVVKAMICMKIDHSFSFGMKYFSLSKIKEMGEFAFISFISAITNILTDRLDPYVVALVSNTTTVAYYGVALTLTAYFGEFFKTTQGVLFPLFSQKEGAGSLAGLERWLAYGSKIGTVMATGMGGMVLLYGRDFLGCWLGSSFYSTYLYVVILISPMIFAYGLLPSAFVLNSTGRHRLAMVLDGMRGGANLVLSLFLGYKLGAVGVAIGTAIPCVIFDVIVRPYYACRAINANPFRLYGQMINACLRVCLIMLPVWCLAGRYIHDNYLSLFLIFVVNASIMVILGYFVLLNTEERKCFSQYIKIRFLKRKNYG